MGDIDVTYIVQYDGDTDLCILFHRFNGDTRVGAVCTICVVVAVSERYST